MRIAACFFGLFRAGTRLALPTIEANLLRQLRQAGGLDIFIHAMLATVETSSLAGNVNGTVLDVDEYKRFHPCVAMAEVQDVVDQEHNLAAIANRMNITEYSETTKLNIVRSRYSVWRAGRLVRSRESMTGVLYTHVVMARPDTAFLAPVRWEPLPDAIRVPNFHNNFGMGVNDRFAYGPPHLMLDDLMSQFSKQYNASSFQSDEGVNSELIMCHHLKKYQVHVGVTPVCIVRVRGSGALWDRDWRTSPLPASPRETPQDCMGGLYIPGDHDLRNPCPASSDAVASVLQTTQHSRGGMWHLAPAGETECDHGRMADADECEEAGALVRDLLGEWTMRPMLRGYNTNSHCESGWGSVPLGCSLRVVGDWATHHKVWGSNCNDAHYSLICSNMPPSPRQPPSPPPHPLAPTKCYQHFCSDFMADCCAPHEFHEIASCHDGLVPVRTGQQCGGFPDAKYECCQPECWVCRTLWKTQAASSEQPRALPRKHWPAVASCGVVVAYCHGDLSWLKEYLLELEDFSGVTPKVTIYSKCGQKAHMLSMLPAWNISASVTSLPNIGRNDHTYAYHMSTRYDSLEDVMIFIKETYNPDHPQGRSFDHLRPKKVVYGEVVSLGFACHYSPVQVGPNFNRQHSVWHNWKTLKDFDLDHYWGSGKEFQSPVRPFGPWLYRMLDSSVEPPGRLWPVCYGGNFAATRERIQAVPRAVWVRIRQSLTRGDNIEEGHFAERTWAGLLNPRLQDKDELLLLRHKVEPPQESCAHERHDFFYYPLLCGAGVLNLCAC